MQNGIKKMMIQDIQIEEYSQLAEVNVQLIEEKVIIETKLLLGVTELNQLLGKLEKKGISITLSDNFESLYSDDGMVYYLDFEVNGWDNVVIEDFSPIGEIRQIRA